MKENKVDLQEIQSELLIKLEQGEKKEKLLLQACKKVH